MIVSTSDMSDVITLKLIWQKTSSSHKHAPMQPKEVLPLQILNFLLALRFDQYCSRNRSEVKKIDKFVRPFTHSFVSTFNILKGNVNFQHFNALL